MATTNDDWPILPHLQPKPFIIEAVCGGCGETFVPNDETDLYHGIKENGTECGAKASSVGGWFAPRRNGE